MTGTAEGRWQRLACCRNQPVGSTVDAGRRGLDHGACRRSRRPVALPARRGANADHRKCRMTWSGQRSRYRAAGRRGEGENKDDRRADREVSCGAWERLRDQINHVVRRAHAVGAGSPMACSTGSGRTERGRESLRPCWTQSSGASGVAVSPSAKVGRVDRRQRHDEDEEDADRHDRQGH